ncbi:unnamed protein product [Linum trigynum]|uniref:Uncharacterized protein n=1 Tax=Linum trigynum TaxID=586398 RepID=A0AAV2D1M2_9ROSI
MRDPNRHSHSKCSDTKPEKSSRYNAYPKVSYDLILRGIQHTCWPHDRYGAGPPSSPSSKDPGNCNNLSMLVVRVLGVVEKLHHTPRVPFNFDSSISHISG